MWGDIGMENITFQQLVYLCAVVLILLGGYNTVMSAIKTHREEKRLRESPTAQLKERVDRQDGLLRKDKDRIDALEADVKDTSMAIRVLLRQSMAVNAHLISGNDVSKLKASSDEIQEYLTNRK